MVLMTDGTDETEDAAPITRGGDVEHDCFISSWAFIGLFWVDGRFSLL